MGSRPHITPDEIGRLVQTARLWLDEVYGDTSQSALDEIEQAFTSLFEQLETLRKAAMHAEMSMYAFPDVADGGTNVGLPIADWLPVVEALQASDPNPATERP